MAHCLTHNFGLNSFSKPNRRKCMSGTMKPQVGQLIFPKKCAISFAKRIGMPMERPRFDRTRSIA